MDTSLLEIVELANGDIVLQRADDDSNDGEPLINIRFSEESKSYMPDMRLEVAKAMIQAGIQAFSEIASDQESYEDSDQPRTIH